LPRLRNQILALRSIREPEHPGGTIHSDRSFKRDRNAQHGDGLIKNKLTANPGAAQIAGKEAWKEHAGVGADSGGAGWPGWTLSA
jgi:hypothetical protein